jgi:hypothetical protein
MNRLKKGYRNEKRCEDQLKSLGYTTWRTKRVSYANLDMFGLFDVVAVAPGGKHLLFIQVKSNVCSKKVQEQIAAFKMPPSCHKQIWIWIDRWKWKVIAVRPRKNGEPTYFSSRQEDKK